MKLLLISSEEDYGFLYYAESKFTKEEVYEQCVSEGGFAELETDEGVFSARLYEFGEVDPKFIDFIKEEVMDYDMAKHKDFVIVED